MSAWFSLILFTSLYMFLVCNGAVHVFNLFNTTTVIFLLTSWPVSKPLGGGHRQKKASASSHCLPTPSLPLKSLLAGYVFVVKSDTFNRSSLMLLMKKK